jgi:hypothetical protein
MTSPKLPFDVVGNSTPSPSTMLCTAFIMSVRERTRTSRDVKGKRARRCACVGMSTAASSPVRHSSAATNRRHQHAIGRQCAARFVEPEIAK